MKLQPEEPTRGKGKPETVDTSPFTGPDDPRNKSFHGYFNATGSWVDTGDPKDYWDAPSGSITRGVRKLVWNRRNAFPEMTPRDAAMLIEQHHLGGAFPNRGQWVDASDWRDVLATTSAEAAVKYSGMGAMAAQP